METDALLEILTKALENYQSISRKRMFGCDAVFKDGVIFGLIWKEGRIGLKYVNSSDFDQRISIDGASRWGPGGRITKHWILLPSSVVIKSSELSEWIEKSYSTIV